MTSVVIPLGIAYLALEIGQEGEKKILREWNKLKSFTFVWQANHECTYSYVLSM